MKTTRAALLLAQGSRWRARTSSPCQLCLLFNDLNILQTRTYHRSPPRHASPTSSLEPKHMDKTPTGRGTTSRAEAQKASPTTLVASPAPDIRAVAAERSLTPALREAALRAQKSKPAERRDSNQMPNSGSLSSSSLFADSSDTPDTRESKSLLKRSESNMSWALDPKPNARSRWLRKMVIRGVRHGGRITKAVQIARSERAHTSASHFFKTSIKKLMPLARQIAGKSVDEAILQMRFSQKKPAIEVRKHLEQAKNEAVVMRGMGLPPALKDSGDTAEMKSLEDAEIPEVSSLLIEDAGSTPPTVDQTPIKTKKNNGQQKETDVYIAEAWVTRGPYGKEPEFRARGRVNILRPPSTGITVVLKEEKTRMREMKEKEEKVIKKRLGKTAWTHLPDRPIVRQSQYVLW